jgi:hypothetical protein
MQLPNGATGLRADYFTQWVNVRPAWERIPAGVRLVSGRADFVAASGPPRPVGERRVKVTSPTRIAAIVKLLNATPAAQQQGPTCPAMSGTRVERNRLLENVRLAFYANRGAAPLAVVRLDFTNCGSMDLSVRGRHEPALLPPNPKRLLAALGVGPR